MGISNPTSRLLNYKIDNEVGATLDIVEIDGSTYLQLLSKAGTILSQQKLVASGSGAGVTSFTLDYNNKTLSLVMTDGSTVDCDITALVDQINNASAVLQEEFTTNVAVGAVSAGTTFTAGTSLESIIKQMLYVPSVDWYVGFSTDLTKARTVALDDETLLTYVLAEYSSSTKTYSFTPEVVKGVFFILLKDGITPASAKLVSQGYEALASNWVTSTITSSNSDWFMGTDGVAKTVTINGQNYTMYGYYNNEWSTLETTTTGVADVMTFNIN